MALIDTPGAADANTYSSVADADAYHAAHLYPETWDDADTDDRERALQMATRLLDQWFEWNGAAVGSVQALLWPRVGVVGPNGYAEPSDAIPARVRDATAELARQLLTTDRTADSDVESQGIKKVKAGSVEVEFSGAGGAKPIPDAVLGFLVPWYGRVKGRSGSGAVTLKRA
jgi:predicted NBD/HSP70 family sugar kinase